VDKDKIKTYKRLNRKLIPGSLMETIIPNKRKVLLNKYKEQEALEEIKKYENGEE